MYVSNEMKVGKAGEYLVCADLILKDFVAYPSEQGLHYDIILDSGNELLKIQVKTTKQPRIVPQRKKTYYAYVFELSRHGRLNKKKYDNEEVDLFALVTLDTRQVGYITRADFRYTKTFRVDSYKGTYYDEKGIQDYMKVLELHKTISNQSEIARQLDLSVTVVNRMLQDDYKPFVTSATYFSEIVRDRGWFLEFCNNRHK